MLACPLFSLLHLASYTKRNIPRHIHEFYGTFKLIDANRRTYYSDVLDRKVEWASILSFHVIVTSGVAILATGASSLESDDPKSTDASLVKAGIALLTLSWAIVVAASVWTLARPGKFTNQTSAAPGTKVSVLHRMLC